MSPKALTALIFIFAGLLATVVIVGLALQNLDVTGVAYALITLLTGVVSGAILRAKNNNNNGGGDDK